MTKESKIPKERAEYVVSVRMTDTELRLVQHVRDTFGVTASKAIRLMLRRNDGGTGAANAAPVLEELRDDLDDAMRAFSLLSRSLDRHGVLLNQIARKVNAGAAVDAEAGLALRACQGELLSTQSALDRKPGQMMSRLGLHEILEA
jgi:hypothetical protein